MRKKFRRNLESDASKLDSVEVEAAVIILSSAVEGLLKSTDKMFTSTVKLAIVLRPKLTEYVNRQRNIYRSTNHTKYRGRLTVYLANAIKNKLPTPTAHHLMISTIVGELIEKEHELGNYVYKIYNKLYKEQYANMYKFYADNPQYKKSLVDHENSTRAIFAGGNVDDYVVEHKEKVRKGIFYKTKTQLVQKAQLLYLKKIGNTLNKKYQDMLLSVDKKYPDEINSYMDGDSRVVANIIDYIASIVPEALDINIVAKTIINKLSGDYPLPTSTYIFKLVHELKLHRGVNETTQDESLLITLDNKLNNCMEYATYAKNF